jgi:alpha-ketoglutaric semialdehyde dehydrogenase
MAQVDPCVLLNAQIESGLARAVQNTRSLPFVELLTGGEAKEGEHYTYPGTVMKVSSDDLRAHAALQEEHFGPVTVFVVCQSIEDMAETLKALEGNLTATIHAEESEQGQASKLYDLLREKAGRLIWNGFPTGVAVVPSMVHGGPYPATTASGTTSVGMTAIRRFMRPVACQNMPDALLPDALKNANPLNIWRLVNWEWTNEPIV